MCLIYTPDKTFEILALHPSLQQALCDKSILAREMPILRIRVRLLWELRILQIDNIHLAARRLQRLEPATPETRQTGGEVGQIKGFWVILCLPQPTEMHMSPAATNQQSFSVLIDQSEATIKVISLSKSRASARSLSTLHHIYKSIWTQKWKSSRLYKLFH